MLIQQLTITPTTKYNFPQNNVDVLLPKRLLELSVQSLKNVQNQAFQLNQQTIQQRTFEDFMENTQVTLKPITLKPKKTETIIAAVDTSTMKIGETRRGVLIAIRGADVWKQGRNYRYLRLGPFIFHVTEENFKELYNTLQKAYFAPLHEMTGSPSFIQAPTRIAMLLERWLQITLSKTLSNGLILLDGSLTGGTPDASTSFMRKLLENARRMGSTVLAFSKMTNLRFNGYLITDLPFKFNPPYVLELEDLKLKPPLVLLGDVYIARLTRGGYAFRLDIDKNVPFERKVEALEKLLGNDIVLQSYPETLRLAHILCTFTANEVIAMQHFISRKYGLKIISRPDMHRVLFGPFGKGDS